MNCAGNQKINCSVVQCRHNAKDGNYCSLDAITVGTHEANPTQCQCTDCMSFQVK